ncbi:MAG TPA: 1-acyl-sn-glycerol-3-phosphate acyltransferase [Chitinivibrionales bacterium]|jgi:1-acyl-sn-glycerol-3-phosphate acyltransferase|nr:1-acyl-sn-glycerol-3-phosphate acyltransferase [Chitinivibrionales bacterium]
MKKPYEQAVDNITDGLEWFFRRAFMRINVDRNGYEPESLKDSMVMVVSTHRSQTDYFLLGWLLYNNGVPYLRIAAGDNLTGFPFIGKRFRAFGAFPVRRDMAFRKSYVRQLCLDVVKMMEDNEPILVFPEGGRSYGGGMMEMKGGILMAAILAQARYPDKKVLLLPGAVSYEHLPELPYFEMLRKGKEMRKKQSSVVSRLMGIPFYFGADIIAFVKFILETRLGIKRGEVWVDFGTPLCVKDLVDIKANFKTTARDEMSGHQASMRAVSAQLRDTLQSLYRLLPEHVVASVIREQPSMTRVATAEAVKPVLARMRAGKRNTKTLDALTPEQIVAKGLEQLRFVNAISVRGDAVEIRKPPIINYYASALSE